MRISLSKKKPYLLIKFVCKITWGALAVITVKNFCGTRVAHRYRIIPQAQCGPNK